MAQIVTSERPNAPQGTRAMVQRVANAYGTFDVAVDGSEVQVGRGGRTAELVIAELPSRAKAEAIFDNPARHTEAEVEQATLELQQIVATEGLVAATLYHEVLAPERDGGPSLAQKLARR